MMHFAIRGSRPPSFFIWKEYSGPLLAAFWGKGFFPWVPQAVMCWGDPKQNSPGNSTPLESCPWSAAAQGWSCCTVWSFKMLFLGSIPWISSPGCAVGSIETPRILFEGHCQPRWRRWFLLLHSRVNLWSFFMFANVLLHFYFPSSPNCSSTIHLNLLHVVPFTYFAQLFFLVLSLSRSAFLNIDELFIALEVSCAPDFPIPRVHSSSCPHCCTRPVFLYILSLHCSH